ncbi:MAG TPA: class I adenylate-forming enzyme family protein [Actinomycetota bacterium]|nr:class I adenylate-forming enzyme family protein [Actinomycetota bacterium]
MPAIAVPSEGDLVAVALPPSERWLEVVTDVWEAGAAILPVDHRLGPEGKVAEHHRARPTVVLDEDGVRRVGGIPVDDGVALVVPTSGTGGEPRLVQFGRDAIDAAVAASALALDATPHDRWLCCLPLAHIGGLLVVLRGVLLGTPVTVHPTFDVGAVAAERDATMTSLVPTMLVRLLDADVDLSAFRAILSGGAHLDPEVRERAERARVHVIETYGLTESCGGVVYDGLPLPGADVRIDESGGIELRGPTLMLGYRFDPDGTRDAFSDDGWLRSGDVGELDGGGRLRVTGRLDDLINTGGEKVWPHPVERVLRSHTKIGEVGVGGRPDREWGQRVVAWVVPLDPNDPPDLDEIRDHVAATLPRHHAPRELVLVDRLPTTTSGKIRRGALRGSTAEQE